MAGFLAQWLNQWPTTGTPRRRGRDEPLLEPGAWDSLTDYRVGGRSSGPCVVAVEDTRARGRPRRGREDRGRCPDHVGPPAHLPRRRPRRRRAHRGGTPRHPAPTRRLPRRRPRGPGQRRRGDLGDHHHDPDRVAVGQGPRARRQVAHDAAPSSQVRWTVYGSSRLPRAASPSPPPRPAPTSYAPPHGPSPPSPGRPCPSSSSTDSPDDTKLHRGTTALGTSGRASSQHSTA